MTQAFDGLICGPPCPPFSSIGLRRAGKDSREQVFEAVRMLLVKQGFLGMAFWILEMVPGQNDAPCSEGVSYYEKFLRRLSQDARMWLVSSHKLNAKHFLPQHRARIYTFGIHKKYTSTPVPGPMKCIESRPPFWREVLHPGLPTHREELLTEQQKENVELAKVIAWQRGSWVNPLCVSGVNSQEVQA